MRTLGVDLLSTRSSMSPKVTLKRVHVLMLSKGAYLFLSQKLISSPHFDGFSYHPGLELF